MIKYEDPKQYRIVTKGTVDGALTIGNRTLKCPIQITLITFKEELPNPFKGEKK